MKKKRMRVDEAMRHAAKLAREGDTDGARAVYEDLIERFPGNTRARGALDQLEKPQVRMRGGFTMQKAQAALDHLNAKRYRKALAETDALIEAFPNEAFLHNLRGILRGRLGNHIGAEKSLREAIRLAPDFGEAHLNLGERLDLLGRQNEAIDVLREAIRLLDDPAKAWNNLGNAYFRLGRHDEAIDALQEAIRLLANPAEAWNNLGNVHLALGRFDDARDAYQRSVDLKPKLCAAHRNLSAVKSYSENDPHIAQMGTMLQQELPAEDQAHLSFGLAKACEDIGREDHAFDLLAHGNRLQRSTIGYSVERDRKLFDKIRDCFTNPPFPEAETGGDGPTPIFVVGMPRSGTSLVEQIVASHSKVHGCGELDYIKAAVAPLIGMETPVYDRDRAETIRQSYLNDLKCLDFSETYAVDKLPINFRWIGFILTAFPEARIVHTKRNPIATGFSIFKQYFPADGMNFSWDLADIAGYYELYAELMGFWHETFPGRIHDLDYEDLTENQESETRRLLDYCGLDFEAACLNFHTNSRAVLTASAMQVRRKIYTGSSEAWRKYEDKLEPLLRLAG